MVALLSIGTKLRKLAPLADNGELARDKQEQFVRDMMAATDGGLRTSHLTERQVEHIERLHAEHVERDRAR